MSSSWSFSSWQDVAIFVGILTALSGVLGGVLTTLVNQRRSKIDKQAADDAAADRLISMAKLEADKRVEIVRTEFQLQIANMELKHRDELAAMKADFEKQLSSLKKEHTTYRCELAPICTWRNAKTPPPALVK